MNMLVSAAATATAMPVPADTGADPIFAAIEKYRQAHDAFFAASDEDLDVTGGPYSEAFDVVLRTRPTTPAGLAALTTWARQRLDWCASQDSTLPTEKLCILSATIDDAVRGMADLNAWTPPADGVAA